jgi:hypothetical protein
MTFSRVGIMLFVIWLIVAMYYNFLHRKKYKALLEYCQQYHPEIYEKIKLQPVFGIFYRQPGAYRASIEFAANHAPLNDPVAEAMLAEYAKFTEQSKWIFILGIIIMGIVVFSPI